MDMMMIKKIENTMATNKTVALMDNFNRANLAIKPLSPPLFVKLEHELSFTLALKIFLPQTPFFAFSILIRTNRKLLSNCTTNKRFLRILTRPNHGDDHMPTAFVLINSESGSENEVVEAMKKIEAVKEVHRIEGVYDTIAKINANTFEEIKDVLTWKLRRIDKIQATLTMLTVEIAK